MNERGRALTDADQPEFFDVRMVRGNLSSTRIGKFGRDLTRVRDHSLAVVFEHSHKFFVKFITLDGPAAGGTYGVVFAVVCTVNDALKCGELVI